MQLYTVESGKELEFFVLVDGALYDLEDSGALVHLLVSGTPSSPFLCTPTPSVLGRATLVLSAESIPRGRHVAHLRLTVGSLVLVSPPFELIVKELFE